MFVVVQDNFLNKEYFKELQDLVLGKDFSWKMGNVVSEKYRNDYNDNTQMIHMVWEWDKSYSPFYNRFTRLFDDMNIYSVQRVKINLLERKEKIMEHGLHIDIQDAPSFALTSILYMNTNNGYTKFETGEKVESVANRIVTFPNSLKHTGSTNNCKAPYRCVINLGWISKPNNNLIMEK